MLHIVRKGHRIPKFRIDVDPPGGGRPYAPKFARGPDPRFHSPELLKEFSIEEGISRNELLRRGHVTALGHRHLSTHPDGQELLLKNKKIEVPSMSRGEIIFLTQVVMSIIGVLILAVIVAVILGDTVFQK